MENKTRISIFRKSNGYIEIQLGLFISMAAIFIIKYLIETKKIILTTNIFLNKNLQ